MTALRRLEMQEGPAPTPGPGWLRLRVSASALGLTQLQLLSGSTSTGGLPRVLGHEMVGRVLELGPGAAGPAPGTLAVVDCLFGCGRCARCLEGNEVICPDFRMVGYTIDGGYADEVAVPAANVFALPAETSPTEAVLLASALPCAVRAVRRAGVGAGDRVAVVGAGSLGDLIGQVCRAQGAAVVLADIDGRRLGELSDRGRAVVELGAAEPVRGARERVLRASGTDAGVDVAFEAAGARDALELALALTRPGGTLLAAGLPPGELCFSSKTARESVLQELTVRGTFAFSRVDFPRTIALYLDGHVDFSSVMAEPVRLEEVPETVERMWREGTGGRRRPVLVS